MSDTEWFDPRDPEFRDKLAEICIDVLKIVGERTSSPAEGYYVLCACAGFVEQKYGVHVEVVSWPTDKLQ